MICYIWGDGADWKSAEAIWYRARSRPVLYGLEQQAFAARWKQGQFIDEVLTWPAFWRPKGDGLIHADALMT
jgi:hypothetical protein